MPYQLSGYLSFHTEKERGQYLDPFVPPSVLIDRQWHLLDQTREPRLRTCQYLYGLVQLMLKKENRIAVPLKGVCCAA